jgi:hypothetical protein
VKTLQEKLLDYMDETGYSCDQISELAKSKGIMLGSMSVRRVMDGKNYQSPTRYKLLQVIDGKVGDEEMSQEMVVQLMQQNAELQADLRLERERNDRLVQKIEELQEKLLERRTDPMEKDEESLLKAEGTNNAPKKT